MSDHTNASVRRAPFPTARHTAQRLRLGRTRTPETPLRIKAFGLNVSAFEEAYIHRHAGLRLGKFALHIQGLEIRLRDESGPHGAPKATCILTVVLDSGGVVVLSRAASRVWEAFDRALSGAARSVRKHLLRSRAFRREKPLAAEEA